MPWNKARERPLVWLALLLFAVIASSQTAPVKPKSAPQSSLAPVQNQIVPGQNQNVPPDPPQPPPLVIMVDASHGGTDSGAALNAAIPEKDVTLVLARRLRQELAARGLQAQLIRDGDNSLSTDQRAAIANSLRPALYVSIHATSQGTGIRLFTALLPVSGGNRGLFVDWQTAQSGALPRSRLLEDQIAAAATESGLHIVSLEAPLRPLNNVEVPALAVEVAPTGGDVLQLASSDYQQTVCSALATGIASASALMRARPGQ